METKGTPRVLVDVDGRAVCARLREPVEANRSAVPVLLLAGGPGQGTQGEWGPTLEHQLAEERPVLTYDRAGSGRSDGPAHDTVAGMATELEGVRRGLGVEGPVILAGWSLGGHVAQGYALHYPDNVAGLVFIDPTPVEAPPQGLALQAQLAIARPLMGAAALASWAGVFSGGLGRRLAERMSGAQATPETTALTLRLMRSPDMINAQVGLMSKVPRYSTEITNVLAAHDLPDVPTVVITAMKRDGFPADYVANIQTSHQTLADRFPRGRRVAAEQASHQVPFDDPDVIVDAVRSVAS